MAIVFAKKTLSSLLIILATYLVLLYLLVLFVAFGWYMQWCLDKWGNLAAVNLSKLSRHLNQAAIFMS